MVLTRALVALLLALSSAQSAVDDASCSWWTWLQTLGQDPFCGAEPGALQHTTFVRHDGYFADYKGTADDVDSLSGGFMSVETAKALCRSRSQCEGFTFKGDEFSGDVDVFFKGVRRIHNDCWTSFIKEVGTFGKVSWDQRNGFLNDEPGDGDDIERTYHTVEQAQRKCRDDNECKGFTFVGSSDGALAGQYLVYYKSKISGIFDDCHTAYRKEYLVSTRPTPSPAPTPATMVPSDELATAKKQLLDSWDKEKRLMQMCVNHDGCQDLQQPTCCPNTQGEYETCCDKYVQFEETPASRQ